MATALGVSSYKVAFGWSLKNNHDFVVPNDPYNLDAGWRPNLAHNVAGDPGRPWVTRAPIKLKVIAESDARPGIPALPVGPLS